jgi:hypothetical protein
LFRGFTICVNLFVCLRTGGGVDFSSVNDSSIGGGVGNGSEGSVDGSEIGSVGTNVISVGSPEKPSDWLGMAIAGETNSCQVDHRSGRERYSEAPLMS